MLSLGFAFAVLLLFPSLSLQQQQQQSGNWPGTTETESATTVTYSSKSGNLLAETTTLEGLATTFPATTFSVPATTITFAATTVTADPVIPSNLINLFLELQNGKLGETEDINDNAINLAVDFASYQLSLTTLATQSAEKFLTDLSSFGSAYLSAHPRPTACVKLTLDLAKATRELASAYRPEDQPFQDLQDIGFYAGFPYGGPPFTSALNSVLSKSTYSVYASDASACVSAGVSWQAEIYVSESSIASQDLGATGIPWFWSSVEAALTSIGSDMPTSTGSATSTQTSAHSAAIGVADMRHRTWAGIAVVAALVMYL